MLRGDANGPSTIANNLEKVSDVVTGRLRWPRDVTRDSDAQSDNESYRKARLRTKYARKL